MAIILLYKYVEYSLPSYFFYDFFLVSNLYIFQ